jgi:hypothetical protein
LSCAPARIERRRTESGAVREAACTPTQLAGWQKLARRVHAPVYCPTWLPDPLDGVIGSRWNNIDAVSRDRSYLESWVWQETGPGAAGGELHVNLRGYPGGRASRNASTRRHGEADADSLLQRSARRGARRASLRPSTR